MLSDLIAKELEFLDKNYLSRKLLQLKYKKNQFFLGSKKLIDFASNDYLSLADNFSLRKKLAKKINKKLTSIPVGGKSSPLVISNNSHKKLAKRIAKKLNKPKVLLFSSAYSANVGVISGLTTVGGDKLLIFQDKLNHASLIDGSRFSQSRLIRFSHLNYEHLEKRLVEFDAKNNPTVIISDFVFSMDGDCANLEKLIEIKQKYGALLMIDDAHGFMMEHAVNQNFLKKIDIYSASFGKAVGGNGAFVATNNQIFKFLINKSRSFIYSTAISPLLCKYALASLKFIDKNPKFNTKLKNNIQHFKKCANQYKLQILDSNTPIQPIVIGENKKCLDLQKKLMEQGFLVGAIRSPTVAKNTERLRISIHKNQKKSDIELLCKSIHQAMHK